MKFGSNTHVLNQLVAAVAGTVTTFFARYWASVPEKISGTWSPLRSRSRRTMWTSSTGTAAPSFTAMRIGLNHSGSWIGSAEPPMNAIPCVSPTSGRPLPFASTNAIRP